MMNLRNLIKNLCNQVLSTCYKLGKELLFYLKLPHQVF